MLQSASASSRLSSTYRRITPHDTKPLIQSWPSPACYCQKTTFRVPHRGHVQVVFSSEVELPLPDGSLGLPILGENLELLFNGDGFGAERIARHGLLWKTNILGGPTVMVYGEEDVRKVLAAEGREVEIQWPEATKQLVGLQSLNLLSGERHSEVKRLFLEAFSERAVAPLMPRMAQNMEACLSHWSSEGGSGSGLEWMELIAMSVFTDVVLGLPQGLSTASRLLELMRQLQGGFLTPAIPLPFLPYGRALAAREEIMELLRSAVRASYDRVEGALTQPILGPPRCLLDQLIITTDRSGRVLSDEELLEGLVAGLFGNISNGPTLSKVLQQLGLNPQVLEAVRSEQQAAVSSGCNEWSSEALSSMQWVDAVVRETLRFRPVVPTMFRQTVQDLTLSGRRVPKGWRVWCYTGMGTTKYYSDTFQPERWMQSDASTIAAAAGCPMHAMSAASSTNTVASEATAFSNLVASGTTTASMSENTSSSGSGSNSTTTATTTRGSHGSSSSSGSNSSSSSSAPQAEFMLPFGAGPRGCVGRRLVEAELKLMVGLLGRGYSWEVVEPEEGWVLVPTARPQNGLPIRSLRKLP